MLAGGVVGPVLLVFGLSRVPASGASLLLNADGVFRALLAWFAFQENFDRRIALGLLAVVAGALVPSWPGNAQFGASWHTVAVWGACLAWGLDDQLTRQVSLADATWVAMVKGPAAGSAVPGFFAHGISLTLFVLALRHLGTARTGAYFSVAPLLGAILAVALLGEPVTPGPMVAGALVALGVWLHLSARQKHPHRHEAMEHEHEHEHASHHDHHAPGEDRPVRHTHRHRHAQMLHTHRAPTALASMTAIASFVATAFAEIVGCHLPYLWRGRRVGLVVATRCCRLALHSRPREAVPWAGRQEARAVLSLPERELAADRVRCACAGWSMRSRLR